MSNKNKPDFPEFVILDIKKPESPTKEYEDSIKDLNNINDLNNKIKNNQNDNDNTSFKDILKSIIISYEINEIKKYCKKCSVELLDSDNNIDDTSTTDKESKNNFKLENMIKSFVIANNLYVRNEYCKKCCEELFGNEVEHRKNEESKYDYKKKKLEI